MQPPIRIPEPHKCALWRTLPPENMHEILEEMEIYVDESHDRRCLLRCRECGQLYFYKFLEFVDYSDGEDPQYRTYIPVTCSEDAGILSTLPEWDIMKCAPSLHCDWPKGQDRPRLFWLGRSKTP